jgi:hypothetical protein
MVVYYLSNCIAIYSDNNRKMSYKPKSILHLGCSLVVNPYVLLYKNCLDALSTLRSVLFFQKTSQYLPIWKALHALRFEEIRGSPNCECSRGSITVFRFDANSRNCGSAPQSWNQTVSNAFRTRPGETLKMSATAYKAWLMTRPCVRLSARQPNRSAGSLLHATTRLGTIRRRHG